MSRESGLKFEFTYLSADGTVKQPWQVLLHIVADFSITIGHKILYYEQQFCIVEFASAIQEWLNGGMLADEDFVYTSIESEDSGLVWIKRSDFGWRIGSVHQEYEETNVFSSEDIGVAAESLLQHLTSEVLSKFRVDLRNFINWQGRIAT